MKKAWRILRMAAHALRRNVMRSMLTCLGIIIGIAAVIAMMEIGRGSSYSIEQTIASLGANVIQMDPPGYRGRRRKFRWRWAGDAHPG